MQSVRVLFLRRRGKTRQASTTAQGCAVATNKFLYVQIIKDSRDRTSRRWSRRYARHANVRNAWFNYECMRSGLYSTPDVDEMGDMNEQ